MNTNFYPLPDAPTVATGYFYGIPAPIWQRLEHEIPTFFKTGSDALAEEMRVAKICNDSQQLVGLHNLQPLSYGLLVGKTPVSEAFTQIPAEFKDMEGWKDMTNETLCNAMEAFDGPLAWIERVRRGYCGWLLTNRQFLIEHDALFRSHAATICEWGTTIIRVSQTHSASLVDAQPADDHLKACAEAMGAFCRRWQLINMAGPYLPVPLGVQSPVLSPQSVTPAMLSGGILMYLPFIYAIPSENELRLMVAEALGERERLSHIAGWLTIVSNSTMTKVPQMKRYGRLFEVQHYVRLLRERHPAALVNNKQRLMRAFAAHYQQKDIDTMKDDFKLIDDAAIDNPISSSCLV